MLVMLISEPFEPSKYIMRVDFKFKNLPNLVVSGNSFVQFPYFDGRKYHNLKVLKIKHNQRLKYIYHCGRKISKTELNSRKYKVQKIIEIPCPI